MPQHNKAQELNQNNDDTRSRTAISVGFCASQDLPSQAKALLSFEAIMIVGNAQPVESLTMLFRAHRSQAIQPAILALNPCAPSASCSVSAHFLLT